MGKSGFPGDRNPDFPMINVGCRSMLTALIDRTPGDDAEYDAWVAANRAPGVTSGAWC